MKDGHEKIKKQSYVSFFLSYCIYLYDIWLIHLLIDEITKLGIITVYLSHYLQATPFYMYFLQVHCTLRRITDPANNLIERSALGFASRYSSFESNIVDFFKKCNCVVVLLSSEIKQRSLQCSFQNTYKGLLL